MKTSPCRYTRFISEETDKEYTDSRVNTSHQSARMHTHTHTHTHTRAHPTHRKTLRTRTHPLYSFQSKAHTSCCAPEKIHTRMGTHVNIHPIHLATHTSRHPTPSPHRYTHAPYVHMPHRNTHTSTLHPSYTWRAWRPFFMHTCFGHPPMDIMAPTSH